MQKMLIHVADENNYAFINANCKYLFLPFLLCTMPVIPWSHTCMLNVPICLLVYSNLLGDNMKTEWTTEDWKIGTHYGYNMNLHSTTSLESVK